ncbi:MAG TPA: hypothetical protein VIC57_17835 [Candidatus Dormibacteraeota bacterium]|jgi:hypothetical protein
MTDSTPGLRVVPIASEAAATATVDLIAAARRALAEARSLPDIRSVMEMASVAADAGRRAAKLAEAERLAAEVVKAAGDAANDAAAVRIEAQARAGELLAAMRDSGQRQGDGKRSHAATVSTLDELGVSKSESSRWQQVASVPADDRRAYVEETRAAGGEVSTAGLLRHSRPSAAGPARGPFSPDGEQAIDGRKRLAEVLRSALDELPTYPPALVRQLDGDDLVRFQRTARRVAQWFGYLMAEVRKGSAGQVLDAQRLEAIYTLVYDLRGLCAEPPWCRSTRSWTRSRPTSGRTCCWRRGTWAPGWPTWRASWSAREPTTTRARRRNRDPDRERARPRAAVRDLEGRGAWRGLPSPARRRRSPE